MEATMNHNRTMMSYVLVTALFSFLLLFTAGCAKEEGDSRTAKADKTLYLFNWTYYTPESVIEAFEEEYGVQVVLDYFASNEDMFAKIKGGRQRV